MMKSIRKPQLILLMGLALLGFAGCANDGGGMKNGRFEAEANGYYPGSRYTVYVTVQNQTIVDVETDERVWNREVQTGHHGQKAIPFLRQRVLENQTAKVDGVAGCTVTSIGYLNAVDAALRKAGAPDRMFSPPKKKTDTQNIDILVMGSGVAGLTAAVKAKTDAPNAKVVLIEKMDFWGGTSIMSGQIFYFPASEADIPVMKEYVWSRTRGQANQSLINYWIDNAFKVYAFLNSREYPGWIQRQTESVGYPTTAPIQPFVPASWSGSDAVNRVRYMGESFNGWHYNSVIPSMVRRAERLGVTIMLGVKGEKLTARNGEVVGAVATNLKNNTEITFNTSAGVILATGGYGQNRALMREINGDLAANDVSQSCGGSTGDGIIMARALASANINVGTTFNSASVGMGTPHPHAYLYYAGQNLISSYGDVNRYLGHGDNDGVPGGFQQPAVSAGENYVGYPHPALAAFTYTHNLNEYIRNFRFAMETRATPGKADAKFWSLYNGITPPGFSPYVQIDPFLKGPEGDAPALNKGWLLKSNTIEGLCRQLNANGANITPDQLRAAYDHYQAIFSTAAPALAINKNGNEFNALSYYISNVATMGGLNINERGEVQTTGNETIRGLYAAGDVANGQLAFREYPSSGHALMTGAVFGYSAGEAAAARFKAK